MAFQVRKSLRFYTFDSFAALPIVHGMFTRSGGVSPSPWKSLNVGGTVGDDSKRVEKNRLITLEGLSISPGVVFDSWQVHGKKILRVEAPYKKGTELVKADGLITDNPDVALMMRFADCVPVMLVDPIHRAVALVHAGWKGTLLEIALEAIRDMQVQFGTKPADLRAGIGPSIGPDHYEVGSEVVSRAVSIYPEANQVMRHAEGRTYLDLWAANRITLERAGVRHIEIAGICTACHPEDWYSHRGEAGTTGRFAAILRLTG